ncbi:hypothetical protein [Streptomyces sp. N35]|uniref:hypothetical protein n=1 Tax=Streptomyces sp. N35 TaxID=2795730 RepID=UPI0018F3C31E|nr:hypothetical protein [Streptomyces sp. N35]
MNAKLKIASATLVGLVACGLVAPSAASAATSTDQTGVAAASARTTQVMADKFTVGDKKFTGTADGAAWVRLAVAGQPTVEVPVSEDGSFEFGANYLPSLPTSAYGTYVALNADRNPVSNNYRFTVSDYARTTQVMADKFTVGDKKFTGTADGAAWVRLAVAGQPTVEVPVSEDGSFEFGANYLPSLPTSAYGTYVALNADRNPVSNNYRFTVSGSY